MQTESAKTERVTTGTAKAETASGGVQVSADAGFSMAARLNPDKPALIHGDRVLTFGELDERTDRLARWLTRHVGLEEVVAVMLPNGFAFVEASLAVDKAGARMVPVNYHLKGGEIAYLVADSGARVLATDEATWAKVGPALDRAAEVVVLVTAEGGGSFERAIEASEEGTGARPLKELERLPRTMFYTSGTTGRPKGVERVDDSMRKDLRQRNLWSWSESDVNVLSGPAYHGGPYGHLVVALQVGATTVILERFDARQWLDAVERHGGTTAFMVPAHFHRILEVPEEERARYDVSSLRWITHAGAPCPVEVRRRIEEVLFPAGIWEQYGTTEGMVSCIGPEEWHWKPGSVGHPWPGVRVRILGDDGVEVPTGEAGLVYIKHESGPRFRYRNDPAKTAAAWRDGYFTVGDVGYVDDDGYLFLTDRASDMIIRGGVNVYPREIELELLEHPAVVDCTVFGVPDAALGERVKAIVEVRGQTTPEELRSWCAERLAYFKVPSYVEIVDVLPRDPNGKVRKRELREAHWVGQERRIG